MGNKKALTASHQKYWDDLINELRGNIPSDMEKVSELSEEGLRSAIELKNDLYRGKFLTWQGACFFYKGQSKKALESYHKAKLFIDKLGDYEDLATLYSNLGSLENYFGNFESSVDWLSKSLEFYKLAGLVGGEVKVLLNLGIVSISMNQPDLSLSYYESAFPLLEKSKLGHLSNLYQGMGACYYLKEEYEKSLVYNKKSREIKIKLGDKSGLLTCMASEASIRIKQKRFSEAHNLLAKIREEASGKEDIVHHLGALINTGSIYFETGKIKAALKAFHQVYDLALENENNASMLEALDKLILISEATEKFEDAYKFQKLKYEHYEKKNLEKTQLILDKIRLESIFELKEKEANYKSRLLAEQDKSNRLFKARIDQINRQKEEIIMQAELLKEANRSLKLFASTASHDIKEPLRMITSFGRLMKKYVSDPKGEEYLNFITTASGNLNNLISDLVSFYRVGGENLPVRAVDLNKAMEAVLFNLQVQINESGAKISYPELPVLSGHFTHFIQLFQNLISNSIKFRKTDISPSIKISIETREKDLLFEFRDNGIGIPDDLIDSVFEPFTRFDNKIDKKGTGLGLATVKKIIDRYKGKIWVECTEGVGSSFYFTIPREL